MSQSLGFGSVCVQGPQEKRTTPPHQLPLYATSSFRFDNIEEGMAIFRGDRGGHSYSRYGNPTVDAVARQLADLETFGTDLEAEAILVSSGMSAIATLMLALLKPGDKILTQENLYGGTSNLFDQLLRKVGMEPIMRDLRDPEEVEDLLRKDPSLKVVYAETPANPTLACLDLGALAEAARQHGRIAVCDNTFSTPYLQQPFKHGFDYVIHSTTKFLNGHGNSIGGVIIGKDAERMKGDVASAMKLAGTNGSPWDAWLLQNGLKTLALRMDKHSSNALALATWLDRQPEVGRVNYPMLPSHPDHEIALQQMRAGGGMLSFELRGGMDAGLKFLNRLKLARLAPTLGDVDTLVLHPASMSHIHVDPEVRLRNGITDGLLRFSVGIEEEKDIIADVEQAMRG